MGRHPILSEHFAAYFRRALGLDTLAVVGLAEAERVSHHFCPDIVIGDYDLLATQPLDEWEASAELSKVPVVAVSLTRRPDEVNPLDVNGIAGFLYLPTLTAADARRVIAGASPRVRYSLPLGALDRTRLAAPQP